MRRHKNIVIPRVRFLLKAEPLERKSTVNDNHITGFQE